MQSVYRYFSLTKIKVFIRYFLYVRNFASSFSSSSYGSSLGVRFRKFFADLRMALGLLEYFDLLSSVYNSNIAQFFIFSLSSTSKEVLRHWGPDLCRPHPHWVGVPQNLMEGGLSQNMRGTWGKLKILSKNTCEGLHLTVKLLPISLKACKCTHIFQGF